MIYQGNVREFRTNSNVATLLSVFVVRQCTDSVNLSVHQFISVLEKSGCQAFLFFLFFSLNSYFSYFLLFFSLNSYFSYFFQILRLSLGVGM